MFLFRYILLCTLLFYSNQRLFAEHNNETYDVIVVGAGMSGLSAATTLRKNGVKNVLLLEAANRIGGRIWTVDPWGSKLELGASWIHGIENSPLFELVEAMNLTIQPTIYNNVCLLCKMNSMALYDQNGDRLSAAEVAELKDYAEKFERYLDEINENGRNHTLTYMDAFNSFVEMHQFSDEMADKFYFILALLNCYEVAIDLPNMSVSVEELYKKTQVSGTNSIIPFGYNLVAATLAKNLSIELNCKVNRIFYGEEMVECHTNKGVFKSKNCIVTVPLGVLKANSITFSPPLTKEKQEVIEMLQVGHFNKIYLFFPYIFWDHNEEWIEVIPKPEARDQIFDIMNFGKYFKQPILLTFTAGSFAAEAENWSDGQMISTVMDVLKLIYGADIPYPSSYIITRWGKDPLFLGSYSAPGLEVCEQTYAIFSTPVNEKLYFAGEATSQTDSSTVLGAFLTGRRAANQVLKRMGIKILQED